MNYTPPFLLKNAHASTIYTGWFRKVKDVKYERERMSTKDGDFIDLDWSRVNTRDKNLIILSHGLEGNSSSSYIKGMTQFFNKKNINTLAWNCRSCSGEINKNKRYYHAGSSDDLNEVISFVSKKYINFSSIHLIGFSMGGNITLKYLGERTETLNDKIKSAVTFSTPVELSNSSQLLAKGFRKLYTRIFLKTLKSKALQKIELLHEIDFNYLNQVNNLTDFDDAFTAPLHGFKDSSDYYKKCSSRQFLKYIKIPTLIVNALDDPFLADDCYPRAESQSNDFLFLETPDYGGHVGFCEKLTKQSYWSERRAWSFISRYL